MRLAIKTLACKHTIVRKSAPTKNIGFFSLKTCPFLHNFRILEKRTNFENFFPMIFVSVECIEGCVKILHGFYVCLLMKTQYDW